MTVIPAKKTGIKSKNDTKCLKNAVKTAKKPVLREKCSVPPSEPPKRGRHPNSLANLAKNFTPGEHARELSFKANEIKKVRAAAKGDRLAKLFDDALNEPDPEIANQKMQLAERAAKFIGSTHDQSDDAKQKIELAGKLDNNLNVHIEKV